MGLKSEAAIMKQADLPYLLVLWTDSLGGALMYYFATLEEAERRVIDLKTFSKADIFIYKRV